MKKYNVMIGTLIGAMISFNVSAELGWRSILPTSLKSSDMILMMSHAKEDLGEQPEGTVIAWKNNDTNNIGTVELARLFQINGHECRVVKHNVDMSKEADDFRFVSTICRNNENTWIILPP